MAEFVLDASIAVSWCFPGDPSEDTPYSRRILSMLATEDAIVPAFMSLSRSESELLSRRSLNSLPG